MSDDSSEVSSQTTAKSRSADKALGRAALGMLAVFAVETASLVLALVAAYHILSHPNLNYWQIGLSSLGVGAALIWTAKAASAAHKSASKEDQNVTLVLNKYTVAFHFALAYNLLDVTMRILLATAISKVSDELVTADSENGHFQLIAATNVARVVAYAVVLSRFYEAYIGKNLLAKST